MGLLGQCLGCAHEGKKPVNFIGPRTAKLAIVGEYSNKEEVRRQEPFVGPHGELLDLILNSVGINRNELRLGNAILCGPLTEEEKSGDGFKETLGRCAARCDYENDLGDAKVIVALGGWSLWGITGKYTPLTPVRGSTFVRSDGRIVIPTWNPNAILRAGGSDSEFGLSDAEAETLGRDIRKAYDLAHGRIKPFEPKIQLEHDPVKFVEWVRACKDRVTIDIEPDSIDPMTCKLLVVGLARRESVDCTPLRSTGDHDVPSSAPATSISAISFWWPNATEECREALMWLLVNRDVTKTFHHLQNDCLVLSRVIDCEIHGPLEDTMLASHARFPDCRCDLASVAQTWLVVEAWKYKYHEWNARRLVEVENARKRGINLPPWPEERVLNLLRYNAWDVATTAAIDEPLFDECNNERVLVPLGVDIEMARVAYKMTAYGFRVDPDAREDVHREAVGRLQEAERRLDGIMRQGLSNSANKTAARALEDMLAKNGGKLNVNSNDMMNAAMDVVGVDVPATKGSVTPTGKRSLNKKTLSLVSDHPFVSAYYAVKVMGQQIRTYFGDGKMPMTEDGRLHMPWKIHGTPLGRWSSGYEDDDDTDVVSVNIQNWPAYMRRMVRASAGNVLIGCDYKAIDYRAIALLSGEESLLKVFNDPKGPDLHNKNAAELFGKEWWKCDPAHATNDDDRKRCELERYILRGISKVGLYSAIYLGKAENVAKKLQERAMRESNPRYADVLRRITEKDCQKFVDAVPRLWPKVDEWRKWAIRDAEENQMTVSPLTGRRRLWPLGMVEPAQAVQTRVATLASDIVNYRFLLLAWRMPKEAHLILQLHDKVVVECPEIYADIIQKLMVDNLTIDVKLGNYHCLFPVEDKIGQALDEV